MSAPWTALWLVLLSATAPAAVAQALFPATRGACPAGATYLGANYCQSIDGSNFVRSQDSTCPGGSTYVGNSYCRSPSDLRFVPADRGRCPGGALYVGNNFCRLTP